MRFWITRAGTPAVLMLGRRDSRALAGENAGPLDQQAFKIVALREVEEGDPAVATQPRTGWVTELPGT
jgi:hypothetical protein